MHHSTHSVAFIGSSTRPYKGLLNIQSGAPSNIKLHSRETPNAPSSHDSAGVDDLPRTCRGARGAQGGQGEKHSVVCDDSLAYKHGLRASEVCNLRIGDVDLKNGSVVVERLKGSLRTTQAVAGHRGQPLLDELKALREWMRERRDDGSDFLFSSQKGGRLDRSHSSGCSGPWPPMPDSRRRSNTPRPEALNCNASGISERQFGTGQNATRSQEHRQHDEIYFHDGQASVTSDGHRPDADLLSHVLSLRLLLSLECSLEARRRCHHCGYLAEKVQPKERIRRAPPSGSARRRAGRPRVSPRERP